MRKILFITFILIYAAIAQMAHGETVPHDIYASDFIVDPNLPPIHARAFLYDPNAAPSYASAFIPE